MSANRPVVVGDRRAILIAPRWPCLRIPDRKALPAAMDAVSAVIEPLCASSDPTGFDVDVASRSSARRRMFRKRVTIVRVFYGPGGLPAHRTPAAHRHHWGEIRSQLAGGPVETFRRPVVLRAARRCAFIRPWCKYRARGIDGGVRCG